ncbi:MAG TPA: hypothetical protein VFW73_01400 [Lacipirellulaceae bacterium]|nr:hypothetical protein [Lacipirellulaceae bacterium]
MSQEFSNGQYGDFETGQLYPAIRQLKSRLGASTSRRQAKEFRR